jgi:pyruvate/2-oxoglutarate dehydrogenase complex dihydrolipoamide dehydrogenase (E3) component
MGGRAQDPLASHERGHERHRPQDALPFPRTASGRAITNGRDEGFTKLLIDIGKTIHPHPTLGESIGMAAEAAHGSCTDLPPPRR